MVGLAQLMVVLDLTVMNIALPSAQRALHFTTVDCAEGPRQGVRHLRAIAAAGEAVGLLLAGR